MNWKDHLAKMDHSKGTSNAMIQKAMKMEIADLKRTIREQASALQRTRLAADTWRAHATRYQKLAASSVRARA